MKHISLIVCVGLVAACQQPPRDDTHIVPPRCTGHGAVIGKVCPTSIYTLISNPDRYYGRTVAFQGYVAKQNDGTILIFPSSEAATFRDWQSSVECSSETSECAALVGKHVEIFGKFTRSNNEQLFLGPAGKLNLTHVRSAKTPL